MPHNKTLKNNNILYKKEWILMKKKEIEKKLSTVIC